MTSRLLAGAALLALAACAPAPESAARMVPDPDGFQPLFDGKTLNGWRGEEGLWRVENGTIIGATPVPLPENTYLRYNGTFGDFEVRLQYRMSTEIANTGLQYRSRPLARNSFDMAGYQANIVTKHADQTFAMLFDEHGRDMMVAYGENARIVADPGAQRGFRAIVKECVNSRQAIMAAQRPYPEWNDLVVIAHGNHLIHAINGVVTLQVVDDDPRAPASGQFGLQIHRDLAMSSEFRNIAVRKLNAMPDLAGRFVTVPRPVNPDGKCF